MERLKAHWQKYRSVWIAILVVFVLSRLVLFTISNVTHVVLKLPKSYQPWRAELAEDRPQLAKWAVWDSEWYLKIATEGYADSVPFNPKHKSSIGFFPLYPILIAITGIFIGDYLIAGIVLSNIFLIASAFLLYALVREDFDEKIAKRSIWYLFLFPTAYIFSSVYPESLLLFLSLASFLSAKKDKWLLSGIFGFFAALTKPVGFLIAIPLIFLYLQKKNFSLKAIRPDFLFLLLAPIGLLSFGIYNYFLTGDIFAYMHIQQASWQHSFEVPLKVLWKMFLIGDFSNVINSTALILAYIILFIGFKKIPRAYWLYAFLLMTFIPFTGLAVGSMRYLSVIFPLVIILAVYAKNETADRAISMSLAILQGFLFVFWTAHYWFIS